MYMYIPQYIYIYTHTQKHLGTYIHIYIYTHIDIRKRANKDVREKSVRRRRCEKRSCEKKIARTKKDRAKKKTREKTCEQRRANEDRAKKNVRKTIAPAGGTTGGAPADSGCAPAVFVSCRALKWARNCSVAVTEAAWLDTASMAARCERSRSMAACASV